jgi:drug/metabolite transporter (DMT)-like permease
MSPGGSVKLSDLGLLAVAFVWGLTFVMVKESLLFISPFKFLFCRFVLSFLFLAGLSGRRLLRLNRSVLGHGALIGVFLFLGYGLQTVGLQYTTPANTGFITGLSVVIVPFLAVGLLKKPPGKYVVVGVGCAAAGLFLLSVEKMEMDYGDFLVLLGAFAFAMHLILVGKYVTEHDPVLLTTIQIGMVALLSFAASWGQQWSLNSTVVQALFITSIFATVMAFLIQNMAQRHTPPTRTAVIFAAEPVFAAVSSYILTGEPFTVKKVAGCLLILTGMLIAEIKGEKRV